MSDTSDLIRWQFGGSDRKRNESLSTPEGIIRHDSIKYGPLDYWNLLDVYRPRDAKEKLPVIVSFHGGAWVYGDKDVYQFYCMDLALRGFAVVNFTYRLAPEFRFPDPLEDCALVAGWILGNAEKYGLDTGNIFAVGDSAGGHLLGMTVSCLSDRDFASGFSFRFPEGFAFRACAFNCSAYTISLEGKKNITTRNVMHDYLENHGTKEELAVLDVASHANSSFPPCFIMTCTGDFLADEAPLFSAALVRSKVPFTFRYYGSADCRLPHVFNVDIKNPHAAACNDDECDFFRQHVIRR